MICRAGDIPKEVKESVSLPTKVINDPAMLRGDYFSKLSGGDHAWPLPSRWKFQNVENLEINMSSLYDFFKFLQTIKHIADFFNHKFSPDSELFDLWQEFMKRNQGWQSWITCNEVLQDSIANCDRDIEPEVHQQALLNVLLSRTLGIFDGDLFDNPNYPINTKNIYQLIKEHSDAFDARF
jgi:hypothetical protein